MKKSLTFIFALLLLAASLPEIVLASGRYGGRPASKVDSASMRLYVLGKEVFNGTAELKAAEPGAYESELSSLQSKLPPVVQSKVDLSQLSGNLTAEQFQALGVYLKKRYKVSL